MVEPTKNIGKEHIGSSSPADPDADLSAANLEAESLAYKTVYEDTEKEIKETLSDESRRWRMMSRLSTSLISRFTIRP